MKVERIDWDGSDPRALAAELRGAETPAGDLGAAVEMIIADVRERGDDALVELTRRFDAPDFTLEQLRVGGEDIRAAAESADAALRAALDIAIENAGAVAAATTPGDASVDLSQGHRVTVAERPVASAAIYVPGGRAAYPSSVVMGCAPARAAGVERLVIASPPGPDGRVDPTVLAAAERFGVEEIYAVGGAQAIAALAFGTATVERVDLVAGPGNAWVTEAKRRLYGTIGIDGLAGPSELVVIADASADPKRIVLAVLGQGEHGPDSPLVVISPVGELLDAVAGALPPEAASRASVADATARLVAAPSVDDAVALSNAYAPEHAELHIEGDAERIAAGMVAGCVFTGPGAATAFGDYSAGSNHVLPTGGAARFGGPLGPQSFMRRTSVVAIPADAAAKLAPVTDEIARAEGLPVHGESARASAPETADLQVD